MVAVDVAPPQGLIRLYYLWFVAAGLAIMIVAIVGGSLWFLNFVHVMTGVMWTGIDLFMGFVLGPILRAVPPQMRKAVVLRLTPKTLFLMPTLATITGTSGWYLAGRIGYLGLPWPQYAWVVGALVLVTLMAVQGLGYLMPTNLRVCFELQKPAPDIAKISRLMRSYFFVTATQGAMQVAIIVIMARFATGI
jgi:hypothetical protein